MARTPGARTRIWKRKPVARDRAWQSIRILRTFTLPDLCSTAEIGPENARRFVRGLELAGIVGRSRDKRNGYKGGHVVWRLQRDFGPLAPRLQRDGTTYDPNAHRVMPGGVRQ